ncbi:MAG: type II toxin-antitoxin system Phd/YefM family antitoxin [Thioploca sp.]|nr:type II toxin-antitoxin system Phd/YefM family antitoxin [Thioploca sp.]
MLQTTIDNFYQNLQQEVDNCIENHEVLHVNRQQGEDFVVISATDWRAIEETLFLNRIPGIIASIHQAAQEPLDQGTLLKALNW